MIGRIEAPELPRGRQGIERKIPVSALPELLLTAELVNRLGIPLREAHEVSRSLAKKRQPAAPFVSIHVDFERLRRSIDERLMHAIEAVPRPRRGRPKGS